MSAEASTAPKLADLPKMPTDLAQAVTGKVELKKVETHEKVVLPSPADVAQEKTHDAMISGIENFETEKLKHAETFEKQILPSPDDIKQEKKHQEFKDNIEHFDAHKLKKVGTEEKCVQPSVDLAREKSMVQAASFDRSSLKHVEPMVKQGVEGF